MPDEHFARVAPSGYGIFFAARDERFDQALKILRGRVNGPLKDSIDQLRGNPLPRSFNVKVDDPDNLEAVRQEIEARQPARAELRARLAARRAAKGAPDAPIAQ